MILSGTTIRALCIVAPFSERTGGGVWRGHPLGRAVRYYWSLDSDPIYADNGRRKVAKTDGAKPLLELTDKMPPDIDFLKYCIETVKIANDLGITL